MIGKITAEQIKGRMSDRRYKHTMGVAQTARGLALKFEADQDKAETAALLHDLARDMEGRQLLELCAGYGIVPDQIELAVPELLHGKVGAEIARREFAVTDGAILDAVSYHTTGRQSMSLLEKVIFVADMIEPGRTYPGVDRLRQLADEDLDKAVVAGIDSTIRYVLERGLVIHPDSIYARNRLLGLG